jgi:hypothetical protein
MKHRMFFGAAGVMLVLLAACSQGAPPGGTAVPAGSLSSGGAMWTANIQSTNTDRINFPDSTRQKSYGSAQWTPSTNPMQSSVSLVFAYAGGERDLSWAILFGNCGSASLPVVPRSNFPELDMSGGGSARMTVTIAHELPEAGTYHVELYRDREGGAASVVGCGNLKYVNR